MARVRKRTVRRNERYALLCFIGTAYLVMVYGMGIVSSKYTKVLWTGATVTGEVPYE